VWTPEVSIAPDVKSYIKTWRATALWKKNVSGELDPDIRFVHTMPPGIRSSIQEAILKRILLIERFSKLFTKALAPVDDRHVADRMLSALNIIYEIIELGRSFVRPEYKKSYQPLMLLWKGIGRFVALNPQYKTLIGPVSISNNYLSISRELIAAFYRKSSGQRGPADMVKSNNLLRYKLKSGRNLKAASTLLHDIQDVSDVISDIETDQKGIPILLKHYMKLGGDILGLTIDHNFSDVMDVLILVDLTRTDPRILERYMGKEAAGAFLHYHGGGSLAHCA
jgi:hypothetical protein